MIDKNDSTKHGIYKHYHSKIGLRVQWFNVTPHPYLEDQKLKKEPGIYVTLVGGDLTIREEGFFDFGKEELAKKKYDTLVNHVKSLEKFYLTK